ncbi:hypothetical protein NPIL_579681 [Nephila pilipes]|uniref:Uncharacterized protein n=1 Tax=Nephila pilipes TaxID=299642 RepID=A0A8X6P4K8_NEPPI|nr:hypothetical protein NPIL_579681 [Nephila pilipes]
MAPLANFLRDGRGLFALRRSITHICWAFGFVFQHYLQPMRRGFHKDVIGVLAVNLGLSGVALQMTFRCYKTHCAPQPVNFIRCNVIGL